MWSLGVMLYELFESVLPFVGATPLLTMDKIRNDEPGPLSSAVPEYVKDTIKLLLDKTPETHPSAA
jgi:hypothetical protein